MTANGSPASRTASRRTLLKGAAVAGATVLGSGALVASGAAATESQQQAPDVTWNRSYRGDGESYRLEGEGYVAYGREAVRTSDGGFAIGTDGRTLSESGASKESYFGLVTVDAAGNQQWAKYYNDGVEGSEQNVRAVAQTADGGYLLAGGSRPATEEDDPFDGADAVGLVVKTDAEGTTQWKRTFAPPGASGWFSDGAKAYFTTVASTSDGGSIVGGLRDDRGWLLRLDGNGNERWQAEHAARGIHVGEEDEDVNAVRHVVETNDDGFAAVLAGGTLVVTDGRGRERWSETVDATRLDDVTQTPDGGFVVAGDDGDFLLARFAPNRKHEWTKTYPGPTDEVDMARSVVAAPDGGYVLAGSLTTEEPGGPRLAVVKTDDAGTAQWHRVVADVSGHGNGQSVVLTDDGGIVASRNGPGLVKLGGAAPEPTTTDQTESTTPAPTTAEGTTQSEDPPNGTTDSGDSGGGDDSDDGGAGAVPAGDEEDDAGPVESFFQGIIRWLESVL